MQTFLVVPVNSNQGRIFDLLKGFQVPSVFDALGSIKTDDALDHIVVVAVALRSNRGFESGLS